MSRIVVERRRRPPGHAVIGMDAHEGADVLRHGHVLDQVELVRDGGYHGIPRFVFQPGKRSICQPWYSTVFEGAAGDGAGAGEQRNRESKANRRVGTGDGLPTGNGMDVVCGYRRACFSQELRNGPQADTPRPLTQLTSDDRPVSRLVTGLCSTRR